MLTKAARLRLFLARLTAAPAAASHDEALALIATARGSVALARGEIAEALQQLRHAVAMWHQLTMPYETALQLSQWMRVRAKECKRIAGDMSRHWSAVGVLEDLKC